MSKGFIGENDPNFSDDMAKKAEEASSRSRDRIDGMTDEAKDIADHTYKTASDVANDPRVTAREAKKKINVSQRKLFRVIKWKEDDFKQKDGHQIKEMRKEMN